MEVDSKYLQAIETIKLLNQAVTTSRLYPAVSPQVSLAVDKAYRETEIFVHNYQELSFGRDEHGPLLCGLPVPEPQVQEIRELLIYRQLDLLGVDHVVLRSGFDRIVFSAILSVFVARKEKINREGGGRSFITAQNLQAFFPEKYEPLPPPDNEPVDGKKLRQTDHEIVTDDQLGYLFNEHSRPEVLELLKEVMSNCETAAEVIVAGVTRVLDHFDKLEQKHFFVRSAPFTGFLDNAGSLIRSEDVPQVTEMAAEKVTIDIDGRQGCLLFVQKYSDGFGRAFFEQLITAISSDVFADVIQLLREREKVLKEQDQETAPQGIIISTALEKLFESGKGKQFLGREKALQLIQEGEKERQLKRVETGVKALVSGNVESLEQDEIVFSLPSMVERLITDGRSDDAINIIKKVSAEMLGGDDILRRRLIQCLILIGENLFERQKWIWLDKMGDALLSWVRESDEGDFVYEKSVFLLQTIMEHAWQDRNYRRGDHIQSVLHKIRSGQMSKSPPVLALVGRIQDHSCNREMVDSLLAAYISDTGDGRFGQRLSMLGRSVGDHLVDVLLKNENAEERLKIVEVLANMGSVIVPVLIEWLTKPIPWFGKRNLIKLAAEVAGPEHVKSIIPFLKHEDIRVQREAFVCIYTISGEKRKTALLKCLDTCSEILYPHVVRALLPYSDEEVVQRLEPLFEAQKEFSENIREPLVLEMINVITRSGSGKGRFVLEKFVGDRTDKANIKLKETVWEKAESALLQLETSVGEEALAAEKEKKDPSIKKPRESVGGSNKKKTFDYSRLPGSEKVMKLLASDRDQAKQLLSEAVVSFARKRKFDIAEWYRNWLIEIDPMALTEIIRAAEVIEEEKVASVDSDYADTWAELYDILTTEEFATLYHAMQQKSYNNEEVIVRQGAIQSGLYFISSGKVKIFFRDKRGDILIKVATKGEILGAETIFDASVWTVSATSMSRSHILFLKRENMRRWRDDYPSLESKLSDFCMKSASFRDFIRRSGKDRRQTKRFKVAGRVATMLLDSKGKETGITSKGDLFDISKGGVSFYLRISQKKNARLLLGRGIRVTLVSSGTASKQLAIGGTIIAVRGHQVMENEYSVHVKFTELLGSNELQAVVKSSQQQ